ncbi:hypothetical protein ABGN05_27165 [Aquibium sp. LZ166]|uniref:DNA-binding protein n=1 Tax=Aquibium pacificus TaxID=3153579 RepID=A0ABV3SR95_9HYPH
MTDTSTNTDKMQMRQLVERTDWTLAGVAKKLNGQLFIANALNTQLPPWRPIPSRAAAHMLGTSLQSLANWRMRDTGPRPEPMKKGRGNRIYYRPDRIAEWLSGGRISDWQLAACWLQQMGLFDDAVTEGAVRERIDLLEQMNLFPPVHRLWRKFRETR